MKLDIAKHSGKVRLSTLLKNYDAENDRYGPAAYLDLHGISLAHSYTELGEFFTNIPKDEQILFLCFVALDSKIRF